MPQIDRAAGLRVKIERAKEHISNFEAESKAFLQTDPYLLVPHTDIQTGESVTRVMVRGQPQPRLGAIAGDAIHNLRAALDLLVWQLVPDNSGTRPSDRRLPVTEHPNKFEAGLAKIKGLDQAAVDLIKAIRPYKGGNDLLWSLHRLDIIDKHHVLLLVGGAAQVITIDRQRTIDLAQLISPTNPTWWSADSPFKVMASSSKIMHTLEHEAELFRGHIDPSNVNMEPLFAFHIAFGEPEIVKGQPVVATLNQFVNLVEGIIEPFRPLLV